MDRPDPVETVEPVTDQLGENAPIHIGELVDIKARPAHPVFAKPGEYRIGLVVAGHDVEHEVRFARRKPGGEKAA